MNWYISQILYELYPTLPPFVALDMVILLLEKREIVQTRVCSFDLGPNGPMVEDNPRFDFAF